ncbi:MAG: class I SAM-dependent methyltransferase [Candidatus Moranbacteria bacterium]|nr:class I SAM-dependent methyltransferase [Candidatus Moranbacteria bacterium]
MHDKPEEWIPLPQEPMQYEAISDRYTELVKTDPGKMFVQFPSALQLLGDVSGKTILDVGCGSGMFDQELSRRGAKVTAYDISSEQIAHAKEAQEKELSHVEYLVSSPQEFKSGKLFDEAVSVLVLHYAPDTEYLRDFFSSTEKVIKEGGRFVCILTNPEFKRLGEVVCNRCFKRLENGKMSADFFDKNKEVSFSAEFSDFSTGDYEKAATDAGFSRFEWIPLQVSEDGLQKLGADYWKGFEEDCLYVGFIAYK